MASKFEFQVLFLRESGLDLERIRALVAESLFKCKRDANKRAVDLRKIEVANYLYSGATTVQGTVTGDPNRLDMDGFIAFFSSFLPEKALWLRFDPVTFSCHKKFKAKFHSYHTLPVKGFSFGCLVDMVRYVPHFTATFGKSVTEITSSSIKFEHDKRRLMLKFHVIPEPNLRLFRRHSDRSAVNDMYQFSLDYSSITSVLLSMSNSGQWSFYLNLSLPPLLYKVTREEEAKNRMTEEEQEVRSEKREEAGDEQEGQWVSSNIHYSTLVQLCRVITFPRMPHPSIVGKSNVLRVMVDEGSCTRSDQLWASIRNLQKFSEPQIPIYWGGVDDSRSPLGKVDDWYHHRVQELLKFFKFSTFYAFRCVWSSSYQVLDQLHLNDQVDSFVKALMMFQSIDEKALELALFDLFAAVDAQEPLSVMTALKSLFEKHQKEKEWSPLKTNDCESLRRCILTPTRLLLLPPLPYVKSRFLRNCEPEYAIRLSLKDDDLQAVSFSVQGFPKHQDEFFQKYIVETLSGGIDIFGRKYEYLGCSTSQLRDHGMVLYAKDSKGRTAESIRREIGDLSFIRNPAKYVARVGLAFSQPLAYVPNIPRERIYLVDDIKRGCHPQSKKPFNFSDGVGKISAELASVLNNALQRENRLPPSAFQIRYAGYKGMLVTDPNLIGEQILMRRSMMKFESTSESMEILKVSEPRYVYLNKPFINILNQKGIATHVFLRLQLDALRQLNEAYFCGCKAVLVLKRKCGLKLPFDALSDSGIDLLGEPFFREMIDVLTSKCVIDMKQKASIAIPEHLGRVMFGVLDETRTLEYGEVFLQYSDEYSLQRKATLVTGEVLVTKFPCMHPGDVRKFIAVDVPELHHIVNCLVFPALGDRPHPNEMAGSDLDGDEYCIIWDKTLIFPLNDPPMIYPDNESSSQAGEVTVPDILKFYCQFVRDHGVGTIANAHLALSDRLVQGIYHSTCLELASKYAVALDYAKTGLNVGLESNEKPIFYPDFMEKTAKPTYQSDRALGALYRSISMFEETLKVQTSIEKRSDSNILEVSGWERYRAAAQTAYAEYKSMIGLIQRQFGIENELVLISNSFRKTQKYLCGKNERSDSQELVKLLVLNVFKTMGAKFEKEFLVSNVTRSKQLLYFQKASAWYMVTRELNENNSSPYYGLPWALSPVLATIAVMKRKAFLGKGTLVAHNCISEKLITTSKHLGWEQASLVSQQGFVRNLMHDWMTIQKDEHYFTVSKNYQHKAKAEKMINESINRALESLQGTEVGGKPSPPVEMVIFNLFSGLIDDINDQLSSYGNELLNNVALAASITLFRFLRTGLINSIRQKADREQPGNESVATVCLSLKPNMTNSFEHYFRTNRSLVHKKLLKSGVNQVVCKVCEQRNEDFSYCLVSATGSKKSLLRLVSALTRCSFYDDIQGDIEY